MTAGLEQSGGHFLGLAFRAIEHGFAETKVLKGIDLEAARGEITCLLGPSGCGKTTLLRLAAGLYDVQAGEISLGDQLLATPGKNPPPEKRPVGLVFQDGALFPHMSVAKNVAFGVEGSQAKVAAADMLEQVGLGGFGDAYPHTLSGGQQQRVALARALAPRPEVLLLDEPFANVDVVLRQRLREETRRILKVQGSVALLVTHDPEEAMDVGDKIAVMSEGLIVQQGSPAALYDHPATAAVAEFLGRGQRFGGQRQGGAVQTPFGLWSAEAFSGDLPATDLLDVVARPDALEARAGGELVVEDIRRAGAISKVFLRNHAGERIAATLTDGDGLAVGQPASVQPLAGRVFAFGA
ncbi:ABC transporter ATP-binding protein [Parvularcula sp. ZS-1/3]|uniref:ABC transporter ATP-binding protein n=1 Tax=Parvularcula mediterranea TaxID=2732508 RepID=A0A7Y3RNY5_9PROT|nr:ABC transporter ATP-binding protein [Parvularcula mediterranea]NNU17036.1 ABC transporter ATP-binding protein [Parvularcula mediterranea]